MVRGAFLKQGSHMSMHSAIVALGALVAAGCAGPMEVVGIDDASGVLSVTPAGGSQGVDPSQPVVVRFNKSMMRGMEMLVLLHERTVDGPVVVGSYAWSADRRTLTFTAATRLSPRSQYVVHLAPDLRVGSGERLNHSACVGLGGRPVAGSMMTSGAMPRAGMGAGMMGKGWSPVGDSHGMMFVFVTS